MTAAELRALKARVAALVDHESDVFEYGGDCDAWGDVDHGAPDFSRLKGAIAAELDRALGEAADAP